jgi:hypothetical protein
MKEISSIYQFFSEINCHFQCYEMGRLIQPINDSTWKDFEQNKIPWPSPFLQHAWVGIIFWEDKTKQAQLNHTVWFLKLPLDEQAQLSLAARDNFLSQLIETLGHFWQQTSITHNDTATDQVMYSLENAMQDNPYGFQPKQEAMANFHAMAQQQLGLQASSFYQTTQSYLASFNDPKETSSNWELLGMQGFADLCARLDEKYQGKNNQKLLIDCLEQLPMPVIRILGLCLENHKISKLLQNVTLDLFSKQLKHNEDISITASIASACIRICAQGVDKNLLIQLLQSVLVSPVNTNIEVLAAISGRCWTQLKQDKILFLYMEALALCSKEQYPEAFNAILSDLMFIPGMRENIFKVFRSTERSPVLTQAINHFIKGKVPVNNTSEIH